MVTAISDSRSALIAAALLALALLLASPAPSAAAALPEDIVDWPERQRAFLLDGPGLLLDRDQRDAFVEASESARDELMSDFLADPLPATEVNELEAAIGARRELARGEYLSFFDHRTRLLFLNGLPRERKMIECGTVFVPLEIWSYGSAEAPTQLVLYRRSADGPYQLWLPLESKRVLYQEQMEYWLLQWEELRGVIRAKRFDLQNCDEALLVDEASGVDGLRGYRKKRPTTDEVLAWLSPPEDLAAWAREVLAEEGEAKPRLAVGDLEVFFPERRGQRIVSRFQLTLPPGSGLEPYTEVETPEVRVVLAGLVEQDDEVFEEFRVRFRVPPPGEAEALALVFERALRPERDFTLHFRVEDEKSGARAVMSRAFRVPPEPIAVEEPPVPDDVIVAMGEELALAPMVGADSVLLAPPESELVLGLWRAEALVSGDRIRRVVFLVDGEEQLTRTERPFSAELRLAKFPKEQVVRAEGYDAAGNLVSFDEVVLNQPRGTFRVRILEPGRGAEVRGSVNARAEVVVPEERRVERVEFRINNETVATLDEGPWETAVDVPADGEVAYLTVVATLDDGASVEEVRFLNSPQYLEEVEVQLVELLVTATDRKQRPVADLGQADFAVLEDGRPQAISRFEQVRDLPLSLGITIDTSGSMVEAIGEAKEAAVGFVRNLIGPEDSAFAVAFSREPVLLVAPTDDVGLLEESLGELRAAGWTSLHDAVVSSLYYFRGIRGQKALVLLSDGDDSASDYPFRDALEFARRSGVVIYTVGLQVGGFQYGVRRKLTQLAEETGGRVFFIGRAEELRGVYKEIEEELRSQYYLAYESDNSAKTDDFRTVEVKVRGGDLKARHSSGYYP